jgi:hypothetical protein
MIEHAIQLARLDDLEVMAGISVKEGNEAGVSALLLSSRKGVMRIADALPSPYPLALLFDPR